jgi:hypothetical protein
MCRSKECGHMLTGQSASLSFFLFLHETISFAAVVADLLRGQ